MFKMKISPYHKQLYLFYTEDGFLDLAIGFMLLFFSLSLLADMAWFIGIAGIFPLSGWYAAKQVVTRNRTGTIVPAQTMKSRFSTFYLAMLIFGIVVFGIIFTSILTGSFIFSRYPLSFFGLVLAMGICGLAMLLHTNRFFIHAGSIFLAMTLGELFNMVNPDFDTFLIFTIIAAIFILGIGAYTTMRFLKTYPAIGQGEMQ